MSMDEMLNKFDSFKELFLKLQSKMQEVTNELNFMTVNDNIIAIHYHNRIVANVIFSGNFLDLATRYEHDELPHVQSLVSRMSPYARKTWLDRYSSGSDSWVHYHVLDGIPLNEAFNLVNLKIKLMSNNAI